MNRWQLVFLQSKANNNSYTGDYLATQNWAWPQGTWFQERLGHLRNKGTVATVPYKGGCSTEQDDIA